MKKNLTYSIVALFFLTLFSACEKDADQISMLDASLSKAANIEDGTKASVTINPNPVNAGEDAVISAINSSGSGKIRLQESVDGNWIERASNNDGSIASFTVENALLSDNGRIFRAFIVNTGGADNIYSPSLTLSVQDDCVGLTLTSTTADAEYIGDDVYEFTTTYEIKACGRAVKDIKLQGGLTAGAVFVKDGTTEGFEIKTPGKKEKNTVISWNVGAMSAGETQLFAVVYQKKISTCGEHTITGSWSAKGKYDDDNTAAEVGFNNNQTFEVDCE